MSCQLGHASNALHYPGMLTKMGGMDYTNFLRRLGATIKQLRLDSQKSQEAVANELGVHQSNLSHLERGKQGFDSKTIFGLGQALNTPLHKIFQEVEKDTDGEHRTPSKRAELSEDERAERELVRLFKTCNKRGRMILLSVAEMTTKANPVGANVVSITRSTQKRAHKKVRSAR